MTLLIPFDNSYARLPANFYARVSPAAVDRPALVRLNNPLARELGLDADWLQSEAGLAFLSGQDLPAGAEPIAAAYAGHQFGHFSPQLGDGRALLVGEILDSSGARRDIQLKGSGPTPFSRRGDGLAALGPVLREYLVSEAMAALGVPTTRALAAVTTGMAVYRERMLPGAILTRIAASHIRVGTFQYFASRGDTDSVRVLADHAIARHDPAAAQQPQPYRAFLDGIIKRQAELVAKWLLVGFIHGVMNTDNMSISGETIDYGPCAFLDVYDPSTVFSSIDQQGRYAYANQPAIAHWNLSRLAECLVPLLGANDEEGLESAREAIAAFAPAFNAAYVGGLRRKIGLMEETELDLELVQDLLTRMANEKADFTLTFRHLCHAAENPSADAQVRAQFADPALYDQWALAWRQRLALEERPPAERRLLMQSVNPAIIPRNHLVEAALDAAVERADMQPFDDLFAALAHPYDEALEATPFAEPPPADGRVFQTFCGT